jgi:hypothetical protein
LICRGKAEIKKPWATSEAAHGLSFQFKCLMFMMALGKPPPLFSPSTTNDSPLIREKPSFYRFLNFLFNKFQTPCQEFF